VIALSALGVGGSTAVKQDLPECAVVGCRVCRQCGPRLAVCFCFFLKEREMKNLHEATRKFLREEDGVTAIEYGLIAALIAVVIIASVALIGNNL
jgi:pilus assembly protein Flp/PilA